jgi:hypothetical protein
MNTVCHRIKVCILLNLLSLKEAAERVKPSAGKDCNPQTRLELKLLRHGSNLAIAMLQLLYTIYVEQRRRAKSINIPEPQRISELIAEVKASSDEGWDEAEFEST